MSDMDMSDAAEAAPAAAAAAAAPAAARRSGLVMDSFMIKQYPAKEQAELKVRIKLPGSWFNNLGADERAKHYEVQAYAYEDAFRFPKRGSTAARTCPAIRFLSNDDILEDIEEGK